MAEGIYEYIVNFEKRLIGIYYNLSRKKHRYVNSFIFLASEKHKQLIFWERFKEIFDVEILENMYDSEKFMKKVLGVEDRAKKYKENEYINFSDQDLLLLTTQLEFCLTDPFILNIYNMAENILYLKPFNPVHSYKDYINKFIAVLKHCNNQDNYLLEFGEMFSIIWNDYFLMSEQTLFDNLTKVYNRMGFFKICEILAHTAYRNNMECSLIMLDIDDFKKINDTYGHPEGDVILAKVGEILKNTLRTNDVVGRYGGEEFMIFSAGNDKKGAYVLAEKIRSNIEKYLEMYHNVTVSVGVSCGYITENIINSIYNMINDADVKLYHSKQHGKNMVSI